jgi:hypothetical protein
MDSLKAQTEIHDAKTNVALADACLERFEYRAAASCVSDAERQYHAARSFAGAELGVIASLVSLKDEINRIRAAIRVQSSRPLTEDALSGCL